MSETGDAQRPELRVTLFTDYICPFCYIGDLRLERLRRDFDLRINFRFLEIHPETPPGGAAYRTLDSEPEQWQVMLATLTDMAREEGVEFARRQRLLNSHKALCLAEAAKEAGRERFYALHRGLYQSYFIHGEDIGDDAVLQRLARASGLQPGLVDRARTYPVYGQRLRRNLALAVEAGVTGTPTFFFGARRITGAVSFEQLQQAAAGWFAGQATAD